MKNSIVGLVFQFAQYKVLQNTAKYQQIFDNLIIQLEMNTVIFARA
jgi:hypothetical protein